MSKQARKPFGPGMDWHCATCGLHRDDHRLGAVADQCVFDPVLRAALDDEA